jgi:putative SOS response-associated peptidase YedK
MFNARLDSLNVRPTWRSLLGRRHGIVLVEKFFEWVEDAKTSKKKVISFSPTKQFFMQVPVLWDYWTDGQVHLKSFALITDDPPKEVLAAGHDRSPICLSDDGVVKWLSLKNPMSALNDRSEEYFLAEDAVP